MTHGGSGWIRDRAILAAILIHLVCALYLSASLSVWTDEGYTLDTTSAGPGRAASQAVSFELQPPVYFVILSLWRLLSHSYLFARAFSTVCMAVAIVLFGLLTRDRGDRLTRALFLMLLAIHPFTLHLGSEARGYALVMAEVAATLLVFHARTPQPEVRIRRVRWPLVAIATLGIYTHYYYGFLLLALGLALLIRRQWRDLRAYVLDMTLTALFLIPILTFLPSQMATHHTFGSAKPSVMDVFKTLYWQLQDFLVPVPAVVRSWPIINATRHVTMLAAFIFIAIVIFRRQWSTKRGPSLIPLATCVLITAFGVLRYLVPPELLQARHMTVLFLPLILTLLLATRKVPVRVSRLVIAMALALATIASALDLQTRDKSGCLRDVGRFIEINEQPQQPLLVMCNDIVLALREHYHGINILRGFPRDFQADPSYLESRSVGSKQDVESTFDRLAPDGTAWFVLYGRDGYLGVHYGREILESWIAENCQILSRNVFCGETTVMLVQRR
jgi:hypothetical protein